MNPAKRWRLVAYDIREPKRYRQVFKLLRGVGSSVQYSIFRCRLTDRELERLRWQLAELMAPEDALLVVDLCNRCAANVISRNHVEGWTEEEPSYYIASDHEPPPGPRRRRPEGEKPQRGGDDASD